jgi:broad specificity phosphatase PhoE
VLKDAHVTALFASEFKRTQETLVPLAKATGVVPMLVSAGKMDDLVEMLRALPAGSRAVVSSHSNLVHLIVERLSGQQVPPLTDQDYDRLVVVTVTGNGKGQAVVLRYGEP